MRINTQSLQFKFLVIVACSMAFAVAVSIGAIHKVYGSIQALDRVSREDFTSQQLILQAQVKFKEQVQDWKNVLLRGRNAADLDKHWKAFTAHEKEAADLVREARTSTPNDEVRARLEAFLSGHRAAADRYRKGLEAFKESKFDAYVADKSVEGVDRGPSQSLAEAAQKARDIGTAGVMKAVDAAESVYRYSIVAIVLAMLATLVVLWFYVRRAVVGPIGAAVKFAEGIAAGDLTAQISARTRDEAGQLLTALGRMSTSLSEVVAQVRDSAENVVTASGQVQAGTADLSQRTEEQASSLEQTAASMEELASTVRQNADNAKEADSLARSASKRAEQGGAEIVHMVTTMGEISDSAKRIADIISVIDGIAFQTNILALNAAVEAARAGEQGRGFAVVATEVRALAQRSAQAAREIKELIGNSVAKVTDGTRLAEQAGDTIQALVIDVKQVSDLMGSIAEASAEQSRGVQQVNKTVTEMDKVVQQNASAVQQSASAAEGMRQQAEVLARAVSTFRLANDGVARAAPMPAPISGRKAGTRDTAFPVQRDVPALGRKKPAAVTASADDWEEF